MQKKLLSFYCGLLFLILFVGFFHPIHAINEDLGRHLLLGEIISQTESVPKTNLLSYTYPEYPFINSHWLSEVVFHQLVTRGGFELLLFTTTVITIFSFGLLFVFGTKSYSLTACALAATTLLPLMLRRSEIRPEVFSFFFVAVFVVVLFSYRSRFTKWIVVLIPLQLLWVNMHLYFVIGILILVLFFVDAMIETRGRFTRSTTELGCVLFFASISCFFNPYGIAGVMHPFLVLQHYGMPVLENQSVFAVTNPNHALQIAYSLFLFFALPFLLYLNRRNTLRIHWLLMGIFSMLGLMAVRNAPLFAYASFFPLAGLFSALFPKLEKKFTKVFSRDFVQAFFYFVFSLSGILLLFYSWSLVSLHSFGFGLPEQSKNTADFFLTNKLKGPVYNDYNTGNYFAYRFYPNERVFVDGRPEAYPVTFFQEVYLPMQSNGEKFIEVAKVYQFNTIILSDSKLVPKMKNVRQILTKEKNYALVYEDDMHAIFVKRIVEHANVINTFAKD